MTVRRLTVADAPVLRHLWAEGLRLTPSAFLLTETELRAIPADRFASGIHAQFWFGAFQGDTLHGYVCARQGGPTRLRHTADIGPLYVTPTAQRQGIARRLMETILAHLQNEGLLQAELSVDATNTPAITLYQSLDFHTFGHRPRSVIIEGTPRNDLLMIKFLDGTEFAHQLETSQPPL